MYEVTRYTPDHHDEWNSLVAQSKQGTFLFDRRYMDYHADRFADHSLMVYRNQRLFALLPGNVSGEEYHSHQGLTYGGLITDSRATATHVCEAFVAINDHLRQAGLKRVVYKPVPSIYHLLPADDDLYALFMRCGARLVARNVSSTVVLARRLKFAESRLSGLRKAQASGYTVGQSDDLDTFWHILTHNLQQRYGAQPVHTAQEMRLLKSRFPDFIRLYMVYRGSHPLGGTVVYLTPQVVHTQYIAATDEGKHTGALDLLFHHLLNEQHFTQAYFDFGTSAQADSCEVVDNLIFQKQGFGGRALCYDRYQYEL